MIAVLAKAGADYKPYWIVNAIWANGDGALVNELSALPEVRRIAADRSIALPEPIPAPEESQVNAVEWNIDRINAPAVWSTFGDTGEGIVVANIDSGVQFDQPALAGQYRGNLWGGNFDQNYNWFDPSNICGNPSMEPCDNNGHGTHTMGTIVGDDGGANQIGVAPGARFIMAKGCETNSCSSLITWYISTPAVGRLTGRGSSSRTSQPQRCPYAEVFLPIPTIVILAHRWPHLTWLEPWP